MAKQKGTNIVSLRKLFREKGIEDEKHLLAKLNPELTRIYQTAMATTMTDVEKQTQVYEVAAQVLFPQKNNKMHELGLLLADRSYNGIYRLFLRIPKPSFVISKAAQIYATYYDKGAGGVEGLTDHNVDFILKDIPELPKPAVEYIGGHAVKLLELAGAKNVQLRVDASNSSCWRWILKWD